VRLHPLYGHLNAENSLNRKEAGRFSGEGYRCRLGRERQVEAKLDYRLVAVDSTSPKLQSSATAKEETAEASVNAALQDEARAVAAAVAGISLLTGVARLRPGHAPQK
jgi:hypothetical protein